MRRVAVSVCTLALACAPSPAADVAIRGATVVDVLDGTLRSDQTVLIRGNRIVAAGAAGEIAVPRGADVVEAQGLYLIPGLWDMHVHSVANVAVDATAGAGTAADWHFPLFVAFGVTGVRDMNDGTGDPSMEATNAIKRRLAEGTLPGPRLLAAGPSLDGDPPLGSNSVVVRTAAEARDAVERLDRNGANLVKVYENLSREAYFAILEEAGLRGIPVDGHVPFRVTPEEAAAAGQRTVEHPDALAAGCASGAETERERFARVLSRYDELPESERFLAIFRHMRALYDTRDPAVCLSSLEAFRRNGVAVAADLVAYHHVVQAAEVLSDTTGMRYVPEMVRRSWEEFRDTETAREFRSILRPIVPLELHNVRLFHEGGVVLLAATDVGVPFQVPGRSLHTELVRLVEAGLTPLAALQTATINPARVLRMTDSLGTVEPGKLADLVLLDANPLEDISGTRRIRAVFTNGRLYRRADLDRLLAGARDSASAGR